MTGVEACPSRKGGRPHEWAGSQASGDSSNPCVHCGAPGRLADVPGVLNLGHFARATAARADLFATLRQPESVKGWGKSS